MYINTQACIYIQAYIIYLLALHNKENDNCVNDENVGKC
jgi:hypothetical protein